MNYIVAGNEVFFEGERFEVLAVEGKWVVFDKPGIGTGKKRAEANQLEIASILPANVALYLMDKQADSLPELVAWVREAPEERRPRLVAAVHQIVDPARPYLTTIILHVGQVIMMNDSIQFATEVADELLERL